MTGTADLLALIHARREPTELSPHAPAYAERLAAFLAETYGDLPILVGPDGPFPLAVLPLSAASVEEVERLSVSLGSRAHAPAVLHRELVDAVTAVDGSVWNGTTFSLASLALDARGRVDGVRGFLGSYFDMIASAGYLEVELLAALLRSGSRVALDDLPGRRRALAGFRSSAECLVNGGGVDAVLAVSTLLLYARDGRYSVLYEPRAPSPVGFRFRYHVLPALIYQPVTAPTEANLAVERSVVHNVEREYLEELFGLREIHDTATGPRPDHFYTHPNLALLRALRATGAARLLGTALVFHLLNHRPEICTLLMIEDESWYARQQPGGPRERLVRLPLDERVTGSAGPVGTLALDDERWRQIARPWVMTPPGVAALVLGAQLAVERLGLDTPRWLGDFRVAPPRTSG